MIMKRSYFTYLVAGLCQYETVAILSRGKLPTLTCLDRKLKHGLTPVLLGGLAVHLVFPGKLRKLSDQLV